MCPCVCTDMPVYACTMVCGQRPQDKLLELTFPSPPRAFQGPNPFPTGPSCWPQCLTNLKHSPYFFQEKKKCLDLVFSYLIRLFLAFHPMSSKNYRKNLNSSFPVSSFLYNTSQTHFATVKAGDIFVYGRSFLKLFRPGMSFKRIFWESLCSVRYLIAGDSQVFPCTSKNHRCPVPLEWA